MFTERNLITVFLKRIIILVVAIVFGITGVFLISAQISKINKSLLETKRSAFILEKRGETATKLRADLLRVGSLEQAVYDAFIPDDNIVDFIATLDTLATSHSLSASAQFGTPVIQLTMSDGTTISTLDFSIHATGNYDSLVKYITAFNALPYFTSLSSISLTSNAPQGITESADISLQGKVYAKGTAQ